MPEYSNELHGVLFKNDRKQQPTQPDYKGQAEVEGVEYWLSAWLKTPKAGGTRFLSISFQQKEQPEASGDDPFDPPAPPAMPQQPPPMPPNNKTPEGPPVGQDGAPINEPPPENMLMGLDIPFIIISCLTTAAFFSGVIT
ncbi:MAG: hypothetical protein KAV00_07030 [Phycisphaerae bacterium]|nr:hypothetical protein [Phycisphaerae bacterium]